MAENTNTKSKRKILNILMLIVALVVVGIVSYFGYAKYISSVKGSGQVTMARWSFKVNEQEKTMATIDLTETMEEVENLEAKKIAPGTRGSFDLVIDGTGTETAIDYEIQLDLSQKPKNLILYRDSTRKNPIEIKGNDGENAGTGIVKGFIEVEEEVKKLTETIYWEWPQRTGTTEEDRVQNDIQDRADYEKLQKVTIPITVIGIQRDPKQEVELRQGITTIAEPVDKDVCSVGDEVVIAVHFSESVYDSNGDPLTEETAPQMQIRFGEDGTPRDAKFSKVEGNIIYYSLTVIPEDKGKLYIDSYKGKVYDEGAKEELDVERRDIVGRNITADSRLSELAHIGEYVNYDSNSNGERTFKTTKDRTVEESYKNFSEVTFSSNEIKKWRILYIDKRKGEVLLVADEPTTTKLILQGKTGYTYAVNLLDDIGEIYGHGKGAESARSIKVEDINRIMDFNPSTSYSDRDDDEETYGDERRVKDLDDGTYLIEDPIDKTITEETVDGDKKPDERITVSDSFYYYYGDEIENVEAVIPEMIFGDRRGLSYWLASRCVDIYQNVADFSMRYVLSYRVDYFILYSSNGRSFNRYSYPVRPVVTLKSNILTNGWNEETGCWDLVLDE